MLNCIIIDDDELSCRVIEEFIKKTEFLNFVKSFPSAIQAIRGIEKGDDVHLIFLDIEMPEMTGIEFLKTLKVAPQVIIVSSKDQYALEAFEYDVTDYLLKPVNYARFYKGVTKAFDRFNSVTKQANEDDEIFIKKNSSLVRLKLSEILWVEALENYVVVNTGKEKHTIHFTMKAIESQLPSNTFKRVHRSFIVNVKRISSIEDNSILLRFPTGSKLVPIGKSYRDKLLRELKLISK
ncbi:LytR/AlgR family response regulator transcription factor [Williamwhitmania taraxaci]|uniref:Two component transcriptional regulator, LytTR family n=1 Tax=Williamwhitmania taraxaci TaxID=1640674 RepID=A0A1G6TBE3_9BACT|nr:LytTR family DNA-binding domain-containing protein [Williamwhitmania taraxaci]SDD26174.1 two component transcriptional regulator, LytTR family [Williamwhitmania taraxaci]